MASIPQMNIEQLKNTVTNLNNRFIYPERKKLEFELHRTDLCKNTK